MTFKDFVLEEELAAEELGFSDEGRSTFMHYLLLRMIYRMNFLEETLEEIGAKIDVIVDFSKASEQEHIGPAGDDEGD